MNKEDTKLNIIWEKRANVQSSYGGKDVGHQDTVYITLICIYIESMCFNFFSDY